MYVNGIAIDFLILADWAEVLNGKIYLQGGGWDTLHAASSFPVLRNVGVGVGIAVPWDRTNEKYTVDLRIVYEDAQSEVAAVRGELETGRPPGVPPGQEQLVLLALNAPLQLPGPGIYLVTAVIDGIERRRRAFRVVEPFQPLPGATR